MDEAAPLVHEAATPGEVRPRGRRVLAAVVALIAVVGITAIHAGVTGSSASKLYYSDPWEDEVGTARQSHHRHHVNSPTAAPTQVRYH